MSTHFRLGEVMEEKGVTNKSELGRQTGVTRWGILRLVQQEPTKIEFHTLEALCRGLNCSPNDLIQILNEDGTTWLPATPLNKRYDVRHRKLPLGKMAARMSVDKKMALVKALIK